MGFSRLGELRAKLEFAPQLLTTIMGDAIVGHREEIADLITEQIQKGETPEMAPIRPKYKNSDYAKKKQQRNPKPAFGTPDLTDTGAFVRSIRIDVFGDGFEPRATDSKAPALLAKYGAVVGLSTMSVARIQQEILKPILHRKIKAYLV